MKKWYLAKSNPQQENWLIDSLTSLGADVYFPRITRIRRRKKSLEPLFPTYMFCQLDHNFLDQATIRWAPGLNYFLGINGSPIDIADDFVECIQESVDVWNDRLSNEEAVYPDFAPGTRPQALGGVDVVFEKYVDSRKRCRLLLQALGQPSAVNPEKDFLSMVSHVL